MNKLEIIGLMSGTSLDGLDIAHVRFEENQGKISFDLVHFETFDYQEDFRLLLKNATQLSAEKLFELDKKIGWVFAEKVNAYINKHQIEKENINAIASHGQTIFHQPQFGFTTQIGCGATLAFHTNIPVINDFRTLDVVAGGQGAPLVPIGDKLLFGELADAFLNIGGFCNISFEKENKQTAFDICPGNLPLNQLVQTIGLTYDKNGELAESGKLNATLFSQLNELNFYQLPYPKSLGTEWLESNFIPLLDSEIPLVDKLRTVTEHVAFQIAKTLNDNQLKSVYLTGGGAKNAFLINRLSAHFLGEIIIPEEKTIESKEALIFALLGALYLWDIPSNVPSVSGASEALILGTYHKTGRKSISPKQKNF